MKEKNSERGMKLKISDKMNFRKLFLFSLPSILMLVFIASYSIVDALFVSKFVSTEALAALNITYPIITFYFALGIMFGTGGSALVSKMLGERKEDEAKKAFSLILFVGVAISVILSTIFLLCLDDLLYFLGANKETFEHSKAYITIILLFAPFSILQLIYQSFFIVISKPGMGLCFTISSGLANIFFDWVFICLCDLGISGAAYGTSIGYLITALGGLIVFTFRKSGLKHSKFNFNFKYIYQSVLNGSSEMVINLASSVTTFIFNIEMERLAGSNGIASITVILYFQFLMLAIMIGYSQGIAPVISFNYGEKQLDYLKTIRNKSLIFIGIVSAVITGVSCGITVPLIDLFSNGDKELYRLIFVGNLIFSTGYLFAGFNIFSSSMFTALNDGVTSAIIAFCRTFLFISILSPIFSRLWGTTGVFAVIPVSEALTLIVTLSLFNYSYKRDMKKLFLEEIIE